MNQVTKFQGGTVPATADALIAGLSSVSQEVHSGGGTPFLKLSKAGVFAYGAENIEVEEGSTWAVNPYSLEHGYAAWGDGELFGEVMVPFNQPAPNRATLQDYGVAWKQQFAVVMQCTSGEDKGQAVLYKGTSKGLSSAMKTLIDAIVTQVQSDKTHIVPIVELDVSSYTHKKYGEIFTPVLDIVKWVAFKDGSSAAEAETKGDVKEAAAPKTRRRRKAS